MASADDQGRFLMQLPGDGDISDDESVIDGDGDEQTNDGVLNDTTDFPEDIPADPIPSTSTGRVCVRGGRGRGRSRGRGGGRGGGRGDADQGIEDDSYDKEILKDYPVYTGEHGPTEIPPLDAHCVDFFDMLFPAEAMDLIVVETNRYADQKNVEWDGDTNTEEMRAFIGMLYFLGIHRLPEMNNYFSDNWVLGVPQFACVFTKRRWWQLWSCVHLANNEAIRPRAGEDGYSKIKPLFEILLPQFQAKFHIGQNVSVDEMIVKGKGKNPVKQYLPLKPIKRGSKVWALGCSCCAYVYDMQVYARFIVEGEDQFQALFKHFQGRYFIFQGPPNRPL